jgi:hypothetical protein
VRKTFRLTVLAAALSAAVIVAALTSYTWGGWLAIGEDDLGAGLIVVSTILGGIVIADIFWASAALVGIRTMVDHKETRTPAHALLTVFAAIVAIVISGSLIAVLHGPNG